MVTLLLPDIVDDEQYEKLWSDDALWEGVVHHVLEQARIRWRTCTRAKGGSNIIYELDDNRIFKLFAPLYTDDAMIEQAGLLAVQRADLGVPSPEILEQGVLEGWHWFMLSRLEGVVPVLPGNVQWLPEISRRDRRYILEQLAEWINASWSSDAFQSMPLPEKWSDWSVTQEHLRAHITRRARCVSAEWVAQIEPFMQGWMGSDESYTVHADLHGRNLLVSKASGRWRLSGVLDFADALKAPRIYDLIDPVAYLAHGDPELSAIFYDRCLGPGHGLDATRMMQWILMHRFAHLGFCVDTMYYTKGRCSTLHELAALMTGLK